MQEREVFNFVHKWPRDFIKRLGCKIHQNVKTFYMFFYGWSRGWKVSFDKKDIDVVN